MATAPGLKHITSASVTLTMRIELTRSTIRPLDLADAPSLARMANNRSVWLKLRDLMPFPYTESDAVEFILRSLAAQRPTAFAIEIDGAAVGVIGLMLKQDIERIGAEVGYWLGEPFWGRGVLSEVVPAFTRWAMREFTLVRLEAIVFEGNLPSALVLEKAGYVREGTLRRSAVKDGRIIDRWMYAFVVEQGTVDDLGPSEEPRRV